MGDEGKMCLEDTLAFRYFNQKDNCQHISNMNYLNRLGYACESCALESYRHQDVRVLKSFLSQVQNQIQKIENNNVHTCCGCVSEIREELRDLKKLCNDLKEDRQHWLEENKKLRSELEGLRKRVEDSKGKDKTLNISVTLTDASDFNVNISTEREPSAETRKVTLKVSVDKSARAKEVKADAKKPVRADKSETKHSVKSERKIWLNDAKPGNAAKTLVLKPDEKPTPERKRIYKSDFLTNVRPKVKDIVRHYQNELRIIPEKEVAKKTTNLDKVRVPGSGYRLVHPDIKMFQRQEKTRNTWISENRVVGGSRLKTK